MNDPRPAHELHQLTRHGSPTDESRLVSFQPLDPSNRPAPFKRYVGHEPAPLPTELGDTGAAAVDVLSGRAVPKDPDPLDVQVLARLLFFTAGVTRTSSSPMFDTATYFRTAMSAGNLHPVEVYVMCSGIDGVPDGVHHFAPLEFGLTQVRGGSSTGWQGCNFVLTGIPWRTAWKYGERGFRHLYWDAGTMLANLLAMCAAHGLAARVHVGFADARIAGLVGVDGTTEFPLAVVSVGARTAPDLHVSEALSLDAEPDFEVEPISAQPITFPLITAAQLAGELPDTKSVGHWRDRAVAGLPAPITIDPPADAADDSIEAVILRRGSTRIMRPENAPAPLLWWAMAAAGRAVPADFVQPGTTLLEHDLLVHGSDGVDPGAYRWRGHELELLRAGNMRVLGKQLCLDQPLGGDSAYTAFHSADLDVVLRALGSRGYRAAQLEAGIASGRLSLAAFALGFGATGLTFFDEAVRRVFAMNASCMLVTSVGIPDYRNTPGGRPGEAPELRNYGALMQRLSLQLQRGRG
jgi:SagB-type dehydrogenase family enzyme